MTSHIARTAFVISLMIGFVGAAGCATQPLYAEDPSSGYGTVPRDEMGEPIWDRISAPAVGSIGAT